MIEILQAHSLSVIGFIQAESMGVTEKERSSTASIIEEMTTERRETGTWIRDWKGRIWRISRIEENPVAKTRTLQLETVFQTLKDRIIPQEITAADMGGSDSCTAAQAVRAILGYQSDWTLGGCDFGDSNPYSFSGEDLMSALETVLTSLEEPWLEFDVSRYPFVLYIRRASQTPQCEMRMSRNIVSMRKSIDMSRSFTRFYPVGKEDLRLPGAGYMSRNESVYGIREKSATDQSRETVEALRSWATEQLYKHARPDVTITIGGIELVAATGESLDRLTVGTVCRVPLPEFGTSENERIIQKSWPDELNRPEDVTVTLGNEIQDVARILKNEVTGSASTAARSGRAGSKKAKEDHAWFVDTEDHVSMVAEAVAGPGASKDWSRVAEITVDGKGIHQRVTETEGNIVTHEARIEVSERAIVQEVTDRSKQGQELSARITVEADKITQDVANKTQGLSTKIEQTATSIRQEVSDTKDGLQSYIDQQRDRISLVVEGTGANAKIRPAQIVASINNGSSSVAIDADHVNITGTTKLNDVVTIIDGAAVFHRQVMITAGSGVVSINGGKVSATTLQGGNLVLTQSSSEGGSNTVTMSVNDLKNCIVGASVSNNVLTLTNKNGDVVNFSKAATLGVQYGGDNSGDTATYTVTGSPAGMFPSGNVVTGYFTVKQSKSAAYIQDPTGTIRARISNPQYGNGWAAAYGKVSLPTSSSTASNFSVSTPPSTVDGSATVTQYTLSNPMNNVAVVKNTAGTIVARLEHGQYDAGYTAGDSAGYTRGYKVTDGDISISVDSDAHTSRGDRVEIWSSRPGFANQAWYYFDVTVHGNTKNYAIYMKRA